MRHDPGDINLRPLVAADLLGFIQSTVLDAAIEGRVSDTQQMLDLLRTDHRWERVEVILVHGSRPEWEFQASGFSELAEEPGRRHARGQAAPSTARALP